MIDELNKNGYLIIRNFISVEKSKNLSDEFIEYSKNNNLSSDDQVPNTPSKYNYLPFLELLCEKTPDVSEFIGETVLPSYSYARIYKKGDVLNRHTDRDACEISLTIHLDGDCEWGIYIQTPSNEEVKIKLRSGDALLYLGCESPHWRNSYSGEYYSQVFLHYVRSKGTKQYAYFDNNDKKVLERQISLSKDLNEPKSLNKLNFSDYIQVYENVVSHELCDEIVGEYINSDEWLDALVTGGVLNKRSRNCKTLMISGEGNWIKNFNHRKLLDDRIFNCVSSISRNYCKKHKYLTVSRDTGYTLLMYNEGGFYVQHTDSYLDSLREVSCSLILNDDYEGGEFAFFNRELKYKLKKGSAIVFPSNFMFPHEIMPVTKGTRYSIITWFI